MKVRDPDDQVWRVRRRWLPWRPRRREPQPDLLPSAGGDLGDLLLGVLVAVLVVVFPIVLVIVTAVLELVLLLVVLPLALLGRALFGRHWTVEVRRGWRPWWEVEAGDWQAASVRIHELADAIRRGDVPEQTLGRG